MKVVKQSLLLAPVMVLAMSLLATPVFARDGADDSSSSTSTVSTSQENEQETESTAEQEATREAAKHQAELLREKAKQDVEKRREALKQDAEKRKTERKEKCASHKQGLETKVSSLNTNAQRHLDHFNSAYAKALQYQKDKNLSPTGFTELTAAADAAKSKAEASVAALNELKPTVDCNKDSTASDVTAFKAAATQARTDLKNYQQAVKAVFHSLIQAEDATKPAEAESENQ